MGKRVKKKQRIRKRQRRAPPKKKPKFAHAIWKLYKIENGKITRLRPTCPKCGPGVFLADHGDRFACGRCGYTVFKAAAASK